MPSENVDVVRRQWEAWESGGLDAVAAFWHQAIEWRAVEGAADDAGVLEGRHAMRGYYEDWVDSFEGIRTEVEEVLGEARVRGREYGTPAEALAALDHLGRDAARG
jgi:ketosteroid isomerase-like protein